MSILHAQESFLETNAWQKPNLNSLRYNTSQAGSVLALVFGTTRVSVNLIALGDYRGPGGGKKGKSGPLPLGGSHPNAKGKGGGGGKKAAGGKKSNHFAVDVAFALAQGPVTIENGEGSNRRVWSSAGIAFFNSLGLNLYEGEDGQVADPVFEGLGQVVGYSGTCYVTGTPMDLGAAPVLPNISFELTGFQTGTAGVGFPNDANPANVVEMFLTDDRWGAGWPAANLDPNVAVTGTDSYADYCLASWLLVSCVLQSQTEAAAWVSELARLTNTAIVWSGTYLKFIPYGDLALESNGATWTPNLIPLYDLTDDDFLPWSPRIGSTEPPVGEDDPVLLKRANPADATNWMTIEYLDSINSYNKTLIPEFDQGSIDRYGLRTEPAVQGSCFTNKDSASRSLRLLLQRALYARNRYRFRLGWKYSRLEQMDIVLLNDVGLGLVQHPVRIVEIDEDDNGEMTVEAEEIPVDAASPIPASGGESDLFSPDGGAFGTFGSATVGPAIGQPADWRGMSIVDDPGSSYGGIDDAFHGMVYVRESIPASVNKYTLDEFHVTVTAVSAYTVTLALADWVTYQIYSQSAPTAIGAGGTVSLTCPPIALTNIGAGHTTIVPYVFSGLGLTPILIVSGAGDGSDITITDGRISITRYGSPI